MFVKMSFLFSVMSANQQWHKDDSNIIIYTLGYFIQCNIDCTKNN